MLRVMRILATFICSAILASSARSEPLSPADREALLENLEKLQETVDSKLDARFRQAAIAYRDAMSSDDAAISFYLKCVEKLNFTDLKKKPSEFREWKKAQAGRLTDPNFGAALRCQLQWLILTLRASSDKANADALTAEAQAIIDGIFNNAEKLKTQEQLLSQSVISTVFAKIFEIETPGKNKWPLSPLPIDPVYKQVIFPPLVGPSNLVKLHAAWVKRIKQEEISFETWREKSKPEKKNGVETYNSPEHEKFVEETIPELLWQMEMDLFRNGDESGAAKRMLNHIETHLNHKSCGAWREAFKALLAPAS